jgi:D-proline reductase (dithiol) PrdB
MAELYGNWQAKRGDPVPFQPLERPLSDTKLGLVTTAGIYVKGRERPFHTERERREPTWGDPSYRTIPRDAPRVGIGASHLHINNEPLRRDINVVLPLDRAEEALGEGLIGGVAETHYSLMGYQLDTGEWEQRYLPEVAGRLLAEGVGAALITPV